MASRPSPSTRTPSARKPAARSGSRPAAKRAPAQRSASSQRKKQPSVGFRILRAIGRALTALWLFIAHGIGAGIRSIGGSARDLDPTHRRDGIGLGLIGLAAVLAASVWTSGNAIVTEVLGLLISGASGRLAWLVPIAVAALGLRVIRHPEESADTGRIAIGGVAVFLSLAGLCHLIAGSPQPVQGVAEMQVGGGYIGWFASAPLVAAVGAWLSGLLLVLLLAFEKIG